MTGKTVIITGASQGIGAGLANSFLERGYNVVATSRRVSQSAEINASDRLARVDGDIADPETAKAVVETGLARFRAIHALVNNAGIFFTKPFIDYTIENYRRLAATNIEGFLHLTQRVVRQMLAQRSGGSIVSITTPMVDHPIAGVNASVAMLTKGGIEAISKNIAMEYAKEGIRVNTVTPGLIDAGMSEKIYADPVARRQRTAHVPAGRLGSAEDVADAVMFLASARASYITGQNIVVDGGITKATLAGLSRPATVDPDAADAGEAP